jgi:hypothetical protein
MSIFKNSFKKETREQLSARQNAILNRTPTTIKYLNSRNAWIRMTSSVNILTNSNDKEGSTDLAKSNILQGGALLNNSLRSGINNPSAAYSTKTTGGQTNLRGIRPMPGINSIDIKSKSAYGSLREVVVNFQCWDIKQLEELELLYMRPGYTTLIEWGWLPYLKNDSSLMYNIIPYDGMFIKNITKEKIWEDTFKKSLTESCNYDSLFGYIKNYSWSARPDGGYDCTTTIISIGEILESLKVNYTPQNLKLVENSKGLVFDLISGDVVKKYKKNILAGLFSELYEEVSKNNEGSEDGNIYDAKGYNFFILKKDLKTNDDDDEDKLVGAQSNSKQIYINIGGLIYLLNEKNLLQDKKSGKPLTPFSIREREYDKSPLNNDNPEGYLLCLAHPLQLSVDPTICYIKNETWGNIQPPSDEEIDNTSGNDIVRFSNTDYSSILENINKENSKFDSSEEFIVNEVKKISFEPNELKEINRQSWARYNKSFYDILDTSLTQSEINDIFGNNNSSTPSERELLSSRIGIIKSDPVEDLKEKKEEIQEFIKNASDKSKYLSSDANDYFLGNDPYSELGIIGNIYVNLQFLYSLSLDSNLESQDKKEKQEISIYDFLKSMMTSISDATGNVNNFDIHVDPIDGISRIIDINYVDTQSRTEAYDNAFELNLQGLNTTVRSYKLESQIFPEQSTIVAIGAQAKGGALGVNSNTMVDFNKNIIDRVLPEKVDANINTENEENSRKEQLENLYENLKTIYSYIGDTTGFWSFSPYSSQFDVNNASSYKNALRDIISYFQSFTKSDSKNRAIIPTKLSIEMDGIGGLIIGHLFKIPENLLPMGYKGGKLGSKQGYIITGISHKLNGKDWVTGIEAQTIILDTPTGDKVNFKESLKEAVTAVVQGNPERAVKTLKNSGVLNTPEKISSKYGNINLAGKTTDYQVSTIVSPFPLYIINSKGQKVKIGNKFSCNSKVKNSLQSIFNDISKEYTIQEIEENGFDIFDGCINVRTKRGGSSASTHSWGIAVDINALPNGLQATSKSSPPAKYSAPKYKKYIDIWYRHGFKSFGRELDRDYMHFQVNDVTF